MGNGAVVCLCVCLCVCVRILMGAVLFCVCVCVCVCVRFFSQTKGERTPRAARPSHSLIGRSVSKVIS